MILENCCFDQNEYQNWLGVSQETDANQTLAIINKSLGANTVDWLIVDHYAIGKFWHEKIKPAVRYIGAIDDLANRKMNCDLLLDQTPGRQRKKYEPWIEDNTLCLCGEYYALLREEFFEARQSLKDNSTPAAPFNIVVSMGGVDPKGAIVGVLEQLDDLPISVISSVTVMLTEPPSPSLVRTLESCQHAVSVVIDSASVSRMYCHADIAIGAGGVSSLERCVVGTPSLIYIYADNQRHIVAFLEEAGAARVVADCHDFSHSTLAKTILEFAIMPEKLTAMRKAAKNICDGQGARRVASAIVSYPAGCAA